MPRIWSSTDVASHRVRVMAHQAARLAEWGLRPSRFGRSELASGDFPVLAFERVMSLRRADPDAHPVLEDGKVTNLRLAAPHFDGLLLAPGRPLSFWRALGRVTAARGFRHGMELRGGCIVPALGGGLCLLSNALFEAAARLGWTIHERHGHSMEAVPPLPGELWGLDATVAWPHVDLRVEAPAPARLDVSADAQTLRLAIHLREPLPYRVTLEAEGDRLDGVVRRNRIRRRIVHADGRLLRDELLAETEKRLLHDADRRRNCLTCGETLCHERVVPA